MVLFCIDLPFPLLINLNLLMENILIVINLKQLIIREQMQKPLLTFSSKSKSFRHTILIFQYQKNLLIILRADITSILNLLIKAKPAHLRNLIKKFHFLKKKILIYFFIMEMLHILGFHKKLLLLNKNIYPYKENIMKETIIKII